MGILLTMMRNASRRGLTIDDIEAAEVDQISQDLWLQINGFAFFYDDRMKANFLRDGAAFSDDKLISGDLSACRIFAQVAAQASR